MENIVRKFLKQMPEICSIEELKKQWQIDSRRQKNIWYNVVEDFCSSCFEQNDFGLYRYGMLFSLWKDLLVFTMCYREALERHLYSYEELLWIMPYIRYAENLKSFIALGEVLLYPPDKFAQNLRGEFQKEYSEYSGVYQNLADINEIYCNSSEKYWLDLKVCKELQTKFCKIGLFVKEHGRFSRSVSEYAEYSKAYDYLLYNDFKIDNVSLEDRKISFVYKQFSGIVSSLEVATIFPFFGATLLNRDFYDGVNDFNGGDWVKQLENAPSDNCKKDNLARLSNEFRCQNYDFFKIMSQALDDTADYFAYKQILLIINDNFKTEKEKLCFINKLCGDQLPPNFSIRIRYISEMVFKKYITEKCEKDKILSYEQLIHELQSNIKQFSHILPSDFVANLMIWINSELSVRQSERTAVLFEMSHSIKNLVATVIDPLLTLKQQLEGSQLSTIERALAGTGLIRALAQGIHYSMRGEIGTWRKDIVAPGEQSTTLEQIIKDAICYAVPNMFDGKYFQTFLYNYFQRDRNLFMEAQKEWAKVDSLTSAVDCIQRYFFAFNLNFTGNLATPIGDSDGTATKLLILFQELFLNAVKYASFTPRENRFVNFSADVSENKWIFILENSADEQKRAKKSGLGLKIIKNFATLFEAEYQVHRDDDVYRTMLIFDTKKEA